MPPQRVVVVADAHLGQVQPATEAACHRFLEAVPDLGDALVINGDLFDFWYEYRTVVAGKHFGTLARLHNLCARGIPVTFVGGNHDRWGGEFLRRQVGVAYHPKSVELEIAGRRALVMHGDALSEEHWSAVMVHRLLEHPMTVRVFGAIHPTIGSWIAHKVSGGLADNTRDPEMEARAARAQAEYAQKLLDHRSDLNLLVLAHTHRPALDKRTDGKTYLNPGAFLDGGRYAVVTGNGVELRQFSW